MIDSYAQQLVVDAAIAIVLAVGLGLTYGHAGVLSLCHATFFGVGAYAAALVSLALPAQWGNSMAASMAVGVGAAGVAAWLVGYASLPLRGDFVALATLAFGELARAAALNSELLGASRGIRGIPPGTTPGLAVAAAVAAIIVTRLLLQSPWGRMMEATRDNEAWARSLAVPTARAKHAAFVTGGAMAGLAGALLARSQLYIHPDSFGVMASIMVLLAVVVGGRGVLTGAVIGGLLVVLVPELLRFCLPSAADWRTLGVGLLLLATAARWPRGVLGRHRNIDPARNWPRPPAEPGPPGHDAAPRAAQPDGEAALEVKCLSVRSGGATIVDNVTLSIAPGCPTALVGPNGSGKTTLGRAAAGDLVYAGRVMIGGEVLACARQCRDRRGILCTTQEPVGFPDLSALDNVRLACDREFRPPPWTCLLPGVAREANKASCSAALSALAQVGLADRSNGLLRELSYGQRKRALLAAALLADPYVLIMDEPFAGLNADPGGEASQVAEALLPRLASKTRITVIIDHRLQFLRRLCPAGILMDGGRAVFQGPLDQMVSLPEFEGVYGRARA